MKNIDSFPLTWPQGWVRSKVKKKSAFKTTFAKARDELFRELKLMGVGDWNVILSTNIPLRNDGLPYAGQKNPQDSGVAVYFKYKSKDMVFACDTFILVTDNLWAIKKTIEALRGIERWGASDMLERSFTGFQAIAAPQSEKWFEILGVSESATKEEIKSAWRDKAKLYHPDQGGSDEMMTKINKAYEQGSKD